MAFRSSVRVLLLGLFAVGLALVLVGPGVAAQTVRVDPATQDNGGAAPTVDVGLEYLRQLPMHADDPSFVRATVLAQLEQQGLVALGTTAQFATGQAAPDYTMHDFHLICDVNHDGHQEILSNDILGRMSRLRVLNGTDGSQLWLRDNLQYFNPPLREYDRLGRNSPKTPENIWPIIDANGDGVCDILAYGFTADGFGDPLGATEVDDFSIVVRLLDGATGKDLWTKDFSSRWITAQEPLFGWAATRSVQGFPTGFLAYDSPTGPKFVFKTTDIQFGHAEAPFFGAVYADDERVTEHVLVGNAKDGSTVWTRDITPATDAKWTNYTWISGTADLAGSPEPEIVLDQYMISNPRGTEARSPIGRDFLYQYGRGMNVLALRGEDGATLWSTLVFDETAVRPNAALEENYDVLQWTYAQVLPDITGDGRAEVLPSYLTREAGAQTTTNGKFVTHFHPLDGASGKKLWGKEDVRMQGWGFAASLNANTTKVPYLGIGTVDLPTTVRGEARFPQKDVRMAVINLDDGTKVWEYSSRFSQDTYLGYVLTLNQYITSLAPHDWDHDGILDLITPSQYHGAGEEQMLLSTQTHTYQILSGLDGHPLHQLSAWGGNGIVVACGGTDPDVTVVSGHARRLDVSRINVTNESTLWDHQVWIDPTVPRAASASFDITFLGPKCATADDGETFFVVNTGLYSRQRGAELLGIHGFIDADHKVRWQDPAINASAPILNYLDLVAHVNRPKNDAPLAIGLGVAPLLPGGAAGGLLLGLRSRRVRAAALPAALLLLLLVGGLAPAMAFGAPDLLGAAAPAPVDRPADAEAPIQTPATSTPLADSKAAPDAPSPPAAASPMVLDRNEPMDHFVERVSQRPGMAAPDFMAAVQDYYHESGFNVPAASGMQPFGENDTISYTYKVGDVNGDGIDDVASDDYCIEDFGCSSGPGLLDDPVGSMRELVAGIDCGPRHRLAVMSGADGSELWNRSLSINSVAYPLDCAQEYVVGRVPVGDAQQLLLYQYHIFDYSWPFETRRNLEHTFHLVDTKTGRDVWSYKIQGNYSTSQFNFGGNIVEVAQNILINPILQVPPTLGVRILPATTLPGLFLQGVGYERADVTTLGTPENFLAWDSIRILEHYQPNEWAERLDPANGRPLWHAVTFGPNPARSVHPYSVLRPYPQYQYDDNQRRVANYWDGPPCCFDLTGDGVPDLVYHTMESTATPTTNEVGPYFLDVNLLVFDGATGKQAWSVNLEKDSTLPRILIKPEAMGDANGDGVGDILLHTIHIGYPYAHILSVRSGKDGAELWRHESPRDLSAWILGDADHDGGNDLLVLSWWNHTSYGPLINQPLTNVTVTPLQVFGGRDGHLLYQTPTVTAPVDVLNMFQAFRVNGFPDLDHDGVGDFIVDDPLYLPDLTVLHRQTVLSGANGTKIFSYVAAGGFAFPTNLGDVTGDGVDDLGLLNGDVVDLWLTAYNGATHHAAWARRILSPHLSNYFFALPRLRVEPLTLPNTTARDPFVNLQFTVGTRTWSDYVIYVGNDGFSRGAARTVIFTLPQLARVSALNGTDPWAVPFFYDANLTRVIVGGPTPATTIYEKALQPLAFTESLPYVQVGPVAGAAIASTSFAVGLVGVYALGRRRWF